MKPRTTKLLSAKRENGAPMREGFTLIELLVVMGIIALLASVAIPSMKGLGTTNAIMAANRQLLQDLDFARARAINERTTVYMVFVPPTLPMNPMANQKRWTSANEFRQAQRLLSGQFTTYALFAERSLGDQPGPGTMRYLTEWRSLPEGVLIATNKFVQTTDWRNWLTTPGSSVTNWPFQYGSMPFPMAASDPKALLGGLPYIAFDYQGRLFENTPTPHDEYISILRGSVVFPSNGLLLSFGSAAEVIATPKGNETNSPVIHIDWLTGRARSEMRSF